MTVKGTGGEVLDVTNVKFKKKKLNLTLIRILRLFLAQY